VSRENGVWTLVLEKINMDTGGYKIILASGSPRRLKFFEEMEIPFSKKVIPIDENFPDNLKGAEIAEYIVKEKAEPFKAMVEKDEIVITADTIVWNKNKCLGKPKDRAEATQILQSLSNDTHQVITAVGFLQKNKWECIHEISAVTFGFQWTKLVPMEFKIPLAFKIFYLFQEAILISLGCQWRKY
jgi:predicted house-cleaning NTP pyrophosphatase (Maf/HAM1 superfamily)